MIRWLWRAASLVVLIAIGFGLVSMALAEEAKSAGTEKPQVLYLHTEFLPYQQDADKKYANRLSRELARQAVLIAARDGLGVQTCDETLDEVPATDAELVQLALTERLNSDGKWRIKLAKFVEGQNAYAVQSLWEKTYDCPTAVEKIYADVVPKLEVDSRGEMVEALKLAGLKDAKKEAKSAAPDKAASGEVEQRLLMPDFIAQFGVVRSAHQAMQAKRESPERLGYLARGYANLASLTKHHWSSATEVFTARAWLYAQRMVAGDEKSALALWNRAYAWALGGSVRDALADVERVDKLAAAANGGSQGELAWTKLVKPFASFDRAAMKKLGADTAELKPWAAYLHFELCNFARYAEWMFDAVGDVGKSCPMAYGVYAEMAHHGRMLAVIRTGAGTAPKAFGYFAPISLGGLADLPKSIRELLPTDEEKREALEKLVNDPNPKDDFSAVLGFFAEKLREAARQHGDGDLSWSVLASLLDEETFVEAALFMKVSTNATEMSLQGLVDSLLPLVKKHRYASFVECFSLGNVRDPGRLYDYFGTLAVRDPRANMISMFQRIGYLKNAQGESIGPMLIANTSRTFTAPGMVEFLFALGQERLMVTISLIRNMHMNLRRLRRNRRSLRDFTFRRPRRRRPTILSGGRARRMVIRRRCCCSVEHTLPWATMKGRCGVWINRLPNCRRVRRRCSWPAFIVSKET